MPKAEVRVYNVSNQTGVAKRTADQVKQGDFTVTEVDNLALSDVSQTTVYFGADPGEKETADAVGKLLKAPVKPRIPELADKPPGVIVLELKANEWCPVLAGIEHAELTEPTPRPEPFTVRRADGKPRSPRSWRRGCMAQVGTHDMPPAANFLTGEQVTIRANLDLLTQPEADERAAAG